MVITRERSHRGRGGGARRASSWRPWWTWRCWHWWRRRRMRRISTLRRRGRRGRRRRQQRRSSSRCWLPLLIEKRGGNEKDCICWRKGVWSSIWEYWRILANLNGDCDWLWVLVSVMLLVHVYKLIRYCVVVSMVEVQWGSVKNQTISWMEYNF